MSDAFEPTQLYDKKKRPRSSSRRRDPDQIGTFEVLQRLGKGGMGVVHKARDQRLKRLVAIKMMLAAEHADQQQLDRFHLEAEAVARLRHPNIVQVFEVSEQDGHPYIALEFIDGPTLTELVQGEPQPPRFSAELVHALAAAMHYAHGQGIVHRDLKPSNILLENNEGASGNSSILSSASSTQADQRLASKDSTVDSETSDRTVNALSSSDASNSNFGIRRGDSSMSQRTTESHLVGGYLPKITDFGLAKQLDAQSEITTTGAIVGTPRFMSPEQAASSLEEVGPAADVYALGAVLYYLLTGRAPFHAGSPIETLMMVQYDNPPAARLLAPGLSKDLETICLKCLEKDPARRFVSANDLAEELKRFLNGEPILARPVGRIERTWRWCRRNRVVAALTVACLLSIVLGFAGVTWKWREASSNLVAANSARAKATKSEQTAKDERNAAITARLERQSSRILFNRGLELCQTGNVNEGVHWFVESLRVAPDRPEDQSWYDVVRVNLGGWRTHIHRLKHWAELPNRTYAQAVSPDGKILVVGTLGGQIYRYDTGSGQTMAEPVKLDVPESGWSGVWSIAFHPEGKFFIAAGGERATDAAIDTTGIVQRFDARTGEAIGEPIEFPRCVDRVVFAHDGESYAVAYTHPKANKGFITVVSTDDKEPTVDPLLKFNGVMYDLDFDVSDRFLLFAFRKIDRENAITNCHIIRIATGDLVAESLNFHGPTFEHSSAGTVAKLPDSDSTIHFGWLRHDNFLARANRMDPERRYAVDDLPPGIAVRDRATPQTRFETPTVDDTKRRHTWHEFVGVSPLHDTTAVGFEDGHALLLDVKTGNLRCPPLQHPGRIYSVAFSPNGALCATATTNIQLWDVATGQHHGQPLAHSSMIAVMAFSPDGKTLAAGDYSTLVKLWNVETGEFIEPALQQRDIVTCLAFSPDSTKLAVGTASDFFHDPQAVLWDLATKEPMRLKGYVRHVEFNADGSRLLTASSDATLKVWDTATTQQVGSTIPYTRSISAAVFSPDASMIVTGDESGDIRGWNAETGQPIQSAVVPGSSLVTAMAFSRDALRFAVGYNDGTSQLFDSREFRPLGPPAFQRSSIKRIVVSNDGTSWTTVLADGTPRNWSAPTPCKGDPDEISIDLQADTGLAIDANQVRMELSLEQWTKRNKQRTSDATANRLSWHNDRALDTEEDRNWIAARWHLDRMISLNPRQWMLHARRARTYSEQHDFKAAALDYQNARELLKPIGEMRPLKLWLLNRLHKSCQTKHTDLASWYQLQIDELARGTSQ